MTDHPFFEFVDTIASNSAALDTFLANPDAFMPVPLTIEQKDALLTADFDVIEPLLRAEFPGVEAEFKRRQAMRAKKMGAAQAAVQPAAIGWNMTVLLDQIKTQKAKT